MTKKIGIFGGAFNPITKAHLNYAIAAQKQLKLDEVWLMPTGTHPDKVLQQDPGADKRLELVEKAIRNYPFLKASDFEINKNSVSYTYETIGCLKNQMADYEFWFLLGEDRIKDFVLWDKYEIILQNSRLGVCLRGDNSCIEDLEKIVEEINLTEHVDIFHMPPMNISSTEVRNRIKEGLDITDLVPHSIKELISEMY